MMILLYSEAQYNNLKSISEVFDAYFVKMVSGLSCTLHSFNLESGTLITAAIIFFFVLSFVKNADMLFYLTTVEIFFLYVDVI